MSKEAVRAVLKRATEDIGFYTHLAQDYAATLKDYDLSPEEAMRIGTGDVRWIESYLDAKVDPQVIEKVFIPILSREVW